MAFSFLKRERRPKQIDGPFPDEWQKILRENVLLYGILTEPEQEKVRQAVCVLTAEKTWEGCRGLVMTDEVRVTIAGQAAVLLVGFDDYYFDELQTILVYPGGFLSSKEDELGREVEVDQSLGEALYRGPVILSWWEARWGGKLLDTVNVVLHEFAHKLAELGDFESGKPPLDNPDLERRWEEVMESEYNQLAEDVNYDRPTLLDPYGGVSRCEFFAVATETFFTQPKKLRCRHKAIYELLAAFYRQDPASRPISIAVAGSAKEADVEYARHVIAECTVALRHCPDHVEAYQQRIDSCCAIGEFDNALADCSALLHLAQGDEEKAIAYVERGEVFRDAGKVHEALTDFDEALRLAPEFGLAWYSRGVLHSIRGKSAQALFDLTEAIRLDPKDYNALMERGLLYHEKGNLEKALRDLSKAIRLCPHDPEAYVHRARLYLDRKENELAQADCAEALRLDPEHEEALEVQAEIRQEAGLE